MNVPPINLNAHQKTIYKLKNDMMKGIVLGDYKQYKNARKAYASEAVKHFSELKGMPNQGIMNVPLFSKVGLNMLYIMLRDKFRIKSYDERQLAKMSKEAKADKIIQKYHV